MTVRVAGETSNRSAVQDNLITASFYEEGIKKPAPLAAMSASVTMETAEK